MQRPLLFASIVTLEPELLMILPVLQTQGNAGLLIFALNPLQGLHGQWFAKPSQPVSALRLGLGTQPQSSQRRQLARQGEQGAGIAGFQLQLQLVDPGTPQGTGNLP